jgi:hypothetical protein
MLFFDPEKSDIVRGCLPKSGIYCHVTLAIDSGENHFFGLEKLIIGPIQVAQTGIFHAISDIFRGPTPLEIRTELALEDKMRN